MTAEERGRPCVEVSAPTTRIFPSPVCRKEQPVHRGELRTGARR